MPEIRSVKTIAIIGAGAAGLVTAKTLVLPENSYRTVSSRYPFVMVV